VGSSQHLARAQLGDGGTATTTGRQRSDEVLPLPPSGKRGRDRLSSGPNDRSFSQLGERAKRCGMMPTRA